MNNYKKIAAIIIRVSALTFFLSAVVEWGIIAAGTLLSTTFHLIQPTSVAFEARLLQSVFVLIAGVALYARSKTLANYIVESLADFDDE
jgi:hypothetical protein